MKAEFLFDGCKCGCVNAYRATISADNKRDLMHAIVVEMIGCVAKGKSYQERVHKVSISGDISKDDADLKSLFKKAYGLWQQRDRLLKEPSSKYRDPFSCQEGFCLTPEQEKINQEAKNNYDRRQIDFDNLIDSLDQQIDEFVDIGVMGATIEYHVDKEEDDCLMGH